MLANTASEAGLVVPEHGVQVQVPGIPRLNEAQAVGRARVHADAAGHAQ